MVLSKKALGIAPSMTLSIDAMAKKLKQEGRDVVGFGAGEPDFDTPENIRNAAKKALDMGLTRYTPAAGMPELRSAIAQRFYNKYSLSYEPDDIVVSNGGKHALFNVFAAILNPGDEVLIPVPYWVTYPELVRMSDGVPVFVQTDPSMKATADDIRRALSSKTKVLILNTPSNPSGTVYARWELEEIAAVALEADIIVVSDEIYDVLVYDGEHVSIASLGPAIKENTIVVNGLSKAYAMTGWRIGYTASNRQVAKVMGAYQSHATSNPNSIAQYAGIEALRGPQDSIVQMKQAFDRRRKLLCKLINDIDGLSCEMPGGAFYVMMNISGIKGKIYDGVPINTSLEFAEALLKHTLTAVVPGAAFGADDYVRLSYAMKDENIVKGLERIKEFVRAMK
jgi:aspartate aminotransferase